MLLNEYDYSVNSVFKACTVVRSRPWHDTAHISILAPPFLPVVLEKVYLTLLAYFLTCTMVIVVVPTS